LTRRLWLFVTLALTLVGADQLTKWLVVRYIPYRTGEIVIVPGWFSLVHARNTGAAFGLMDDFQYRMYVFAAFTVVAVAVLAHMAWKLPEDDRFQTVALAMIASGAAGNAIDRVRQQYVTDFLRAYVDAAGPKAWLVAHVGTYEWPSFNVADSCIVVGLGLFVVYYLFFQRDEAVEPEPPVEPVSDLPQPR